MSDYRTEILKYLLDEAVDMIDAAPAPVRDRPSVSGARAELVALLDDMESNPGTFHDGTGTPPNP